MCLIESGCEIPLGGVGIYLKCRRASAPVVKGVCRKRKTLLFGICGAESHRRVLRIYEIEMRRLRCGQGFRQYEIRIGGVERGLALGVLVCRVSEGQPFARVNRLERLQRASRSGNVYSVVCPPETCSFRTAVVLESVEIRGVGNVVGCARGEIRSAHEHVEIGRLGESCRGGKSGASQ